MSPALRSLLSPFSLFPANGQAKHRRSHSGCRRGALNRSRRRASIETLEDRQLLSVALGTSAGFGKAQTLADLPVTAQSAVSAAIGRDQAAYHAAASAQGFTLANPANGFTASVQSGVLAISSGADRWDMTLDGLGYDGAIGPVGTATVKAAGNRVDASYASVDAWYVNGPQGLEQGFTIAGVPPLGGLPGDSPAKAGTPTELTVELALGGDLTATANAAGDGLKLVQPDGIAALGYNGLSAYDSTGRALPASLEVCSVGGKQELLIHVNDAGAKGPITIDPFIQQAELTASDGAADNKLGNSIAVSGNTVVVGADSATVGGNIYRGAAYVFVEPSSGWANMTQMAKLTASDGTVSAYFGWSVAISGNTVVVGEPQIITGTYAGPGAAYVFVEPAAGWSGNLTQTAKLTASDGAVADRFGVSVGISGNTVVVGANCATVSGNTYQGAAYVFVEPSSGWSGNLTQTAKLIASDGAADNYFGRSVGITGNTVVVGAEATVGGNADQGAAYVFTEPGSGWVSMTQTAKLTASDGAADNYFGNSLAISGNTVVIGAYEATVGGNADQGAAYVFTEPGSGWASMTQTAKLTASDGAADNYFGFSVAISGNTVVVGAWGATVGGNADQGAAYVFTEPGSGWANMTQAAKLTASDGAADDQFGQSAAVSGNTVVVGAICATVGGNADQGAAYVFTSGLTLSPTTLPVGTENMAYNQTITASGEGTDPITMTVSDIEVNGVAGPGISGLTMVDNGNGSLSIGGTPTAAGTETFTVTATDTVTGNTASANYSLTVQAITLAPATLPADTVNVPYNQTISAVGGSGTVTLTTNVTAAVAGLVVPASGTGSLSISGTPTATGTETFTVTATDPAGDTASASYSITVNPTVTLSPATLPAGNVNAAYNQAITASGGTGTVTLSVSNITGAISGLNVPASGTGSLSISGTPTAMGTETFTVTATDSLGVKATANYSITVNSAVATSSNWAGYAVSTSAGAVTDVKGSWIEPKLQSPSAANTYSAFWVGIDGYSSSTVEQIGTDLDTNASGKAVYYAWYEMYPSSPVDISMTINPGDQISGQVQYSGSNKFTLTLTDVTTNKTFSTVQTLKSAQMSSAEWIAEAPSSSKGVLPLANFGTVSFSAASATISGTTGPIDSKAWPAGNPVAITMVGSSGTKAYPTSIVDTSGTSAFSASWAAANSVMLRGPASLDEVDDWFFPNSKKDHRLWDLALASPDAVWV